MDASKTHFHYESLCKCFVSIQPHKPSIQQLAGPYCILFCQGLQQKLPGNACSNFQMHPRERCPANLPLRVLKSQMSSDSWKQLLCPLPQPQTPSCTLVGVRHASQEGKPKAEGTLGGHIFCCQFKKMGIQICDNPWTINVSTINLPSGLYSMDSQPWLHIGITQGV